MRYRFICNWCDDSSLRDRLLRNFFKPDGMELVTDGSFDILISINHDSSLPLLPTYRPESSYCFTMEPGWSPNLRFSAGSFKKVFTHIEGRWENAEYTTSLMFYHLTEDKEFLLSTRFAKPKKLSFIVSNIRGGHLYDFRTGLVEELLRTDLDFDLYGYGWDLVDGRYKGGLGSKSDGLRDYEYSICIENSSERGYVTEKLTDCFMTDTVPIYYGCPNISDIYDKDTMHILDAEHPLEHILSILSSTNVKDTRPSKLRYFERYDLLKFAWENCR